MMMKTGESRRSARASGQEIGMLISIAAAPASSIHREKLRIRTCTFSRSFLASNCATYFVTTAWNEIAPMVTMRKIALRELKPLNAPVSCSMRVMMTL